MPLVSEDLSLLVLVVDVNPFFWALRPPSLPTFHDFLSQLRVFLNAYLLLHSANRAAVIATGHSCWSAAVSQLLSFATAETERAKREAAAGTAEGGESAGREDGDGGTERMEGVEGNGAMDREMRDREGSQEGGVSGGREGGESGGKGLVGDQASLLSGSLRLKASVSAVRVPIDACAIGEADSAFLQQAAFLTGGLYLHSTRPNALLQDLLLVFGVDQFSRDFITLPQPSAVDFRASCFCHKRPVDMGFVCSVCLSIFCSPARTCATCG
ncbi:unnamed protein product [Closterium sp. NIES-65]|nr:unnamed protein product [Closterium sp. NIES-65]